MLLIKRRQLRWSTQDTGYLSRGWRRCVVNPLSIFGVHSLELELTVTCIYCFLTHFECLTIGYFVSNWSAIHDLETRLGFYNFYFYNFLKKNIFYGQILTMIYYYPHINLKVSHTILISCLYSKLRNRPLFHKTPTKFQSYTTT